MKKGTTKGIKFSINTNAKLRQLREELRRLKRWMEERIGEDMCPFGKELTQNIRNYRNRPEMYNTLVSHVGLTGCEYCKSFMEENSNYFEDETQ